MPREFLIPISSEPPFEAAAKFIAAMTYPDYESARNRYAFGLCRWIIIKRARLDNEWRGSEVMLRPDYLFWNDKKQSLFKKSHKYFFRLLTVGAHQVFPYVPTFVGEKANKTFDDIEASAENCMASAMTAMGFGSGSITTVRSRYWKPAKPVCHALAALLHAGSLLDEHSAECCGGDPMLEIFFNPEALAVVLGLAEIFRARIPTIEGIRIDPDKLVRFIRA